MRHFANAFVVLTFVVVSGCAQPGIDQPIAAAGVSGAAPASAEQIPARCPSPVLITVHRDISRSTGPTGTPDVTEVDLQALVDGVLRICGGELFYGEIGTNSFKPFARLRISEPPTMPERPTLDANPFIRAEQEEQIQVKQRGWETTRRAWLAAADPDILAFFARVRPLLKRAPNDGATDVYGAVERAVLALSEPPAGWSVPPRKLMLLATDGQHTTKRGRASAPPADITMLVAGTPGVLEPYSPSVFEGTAAAVRYLRLLVQQEN